jgi:protein transport protein SEC61 subunit gamma-like protein
MIPLKFSEYSRILRLTRKPTREEFLMIAKVAGAGILIIGVIGFIIYFFLTEIPKMM